MKLPRAVGLETRTDGKVRLGTQSLDDINIRGVTANIADMDVEEVETGRYITDADNDGRTEVAFIGQQVAAKAFPYGRSHRQDDLRRWPRLSGSRRSQADWKPSSGNPRTILSTSRSGHS